MEGQDIPTASNHLIYVPEHLGTLFTPFFDLLGVTDIHGTSLRPLPCHYEFMLTLYFGDNPNKAVRFFASDGYGNHETLTPWI